MRTMELLANSQSVQIHTKKALKIDFLTPPLTSGLALKSALPARIWGTVDTIRRYWPPGAIPECSIVTALDSTLNSDALARSQLSSPICKGEKQRKIFPYSKNLDVITTGFLFPGNKEIRRAMPIFAGTMTRIIVISVFILWTATGQGKENVFTEKGLSLLGYHLCNYSMTKTVSKMAAYQKSYEKHTSCGGWIPWMVCPKMSYKTQYHIIEVPEIMNFTDCCEGYEQVGFYCTLSLNRSSEFASRPGVCPEEEMDSLNYSCTLDTDCPGLKKCCNSSKGAGCVDPIPEDVNECSHAELNACSRSELCINLEGGYNCTCEREHVDGNSSQPQKEFKDLFSIGNHRIVSVTSSSFEVSWSVYSTLNHTFQVQVYKGKELITSMETTEMKRDVSGLEAGIKYTVKISYEACGKNIISYRHVKTDAQIFGVTIKILNYSFTEHFHNTSSSEYQEFSSLLLREIENSFPPNISILYKTGKLKVQIESLKPGSIIVRLRIIVQDPEFPTDVSTFAPMLSSLNRSSVFLVDQQSTSVEDWDECASRSENDCCMYAECINLMGSYMCRCKTTMDTNPSRPGRNCEGEIVNPLTETMPLYESGGTEIPPETSTGLHASPAITEIRTMTTLSSKRSTTLNTPTLLPSSGTQASSSHSSISSPPVTQRPGMISSIGFERNNRTIGMEGPTTIKTLVVVTEQWKDVSASLENSMEETLTGAPQPLTTVTNASMDATSQERHTSPLPTLYMVSNTTSAVVRNKSIGETHIPLQVPEASSQDGSSTSLPTTENRTIYTINSTLDVHEVIRKVSNSWSETSPKESFSVPAVSPDFSPPAFSATTFPTTDCTPVPAQRIIFSNVTSISFHVAWSTDSALNPAFRFLLLQEKQLIWEAQTESTSLTVSGLEPGILYTVEIVTEVCGKESKPARQKVKTAVQKLNGSVRITNVKYTEGLSNASSEQYRNFIQLFLGEVRKSLPLKFLQEMDLGLIKMLITSITNGSIVVGFDLLTAKDLDIHHLSTDFQDVFKNSSYFTVDNNSISIRDSALYLGEPHCNVRFSNDTRVVLWTAWNECGTEVQSNKTNTIVKTILQNDISSQRVIHNLKIVIPIHCVFQNDLLTSSGYDAEGVYTFFEDLHGSGYFITEMQLFVGNSSIPKNFSVSASDDILIEVGIQKGDSKLKVVITECWATPSSNPVDPLSFAFINNSCPVPETYTTIIENGNSRKAQLKLKIFSFINHTVVYLHCKIRICVETPESTCRTSCRDIRSLKSGEIIATHRSSWGPLCRATGGEGNLKKKGLDHPRVRKNKHWAKKCDEFDKLYNQLLDHILVCYEIYSRDQIAKLMLSNCSDEADISIEARKQGKSCDCKVKAGGPDAISYSSSFVDLPTKFYSSGFCKIILMTGKR
ncbi:Uromodulin-like 1 [Chelonia mydas]|uniref:Uromodulin-like 1 n=1 Tax=Chelonia mydas TaxID=8469 RepID=M7BHA5_CHEMY|nr:Uromodulin-like 1 [Chelonia mydas]